MNIFKNLNLLKKKTLNKWTLIYCTKKNEEFTFFFFKEYLIVNVLNKLFLKNNLVLLNCQLFNSNSLIHVYISYINFKTKKVKTSSEQKISLFLRKIIKILNNYTNDKLNFYFILQNIQKYLIQLNIFLSYCSIKNFIFSKLKKYQIKYKFLKNLLQIFFFVITKLNSSQLLSNYISYICKIKFFKKDHLKFFKLFKIIISKIIKSKISIVSGIKIVLSGRINGLSRSRIKSFQYGNMPINTFNVHINHSFKTSYTVNGTLGVKVWILYKKISSIIKNDF